MSNGATIKHLWEGYDPDKDKDGKEYRTMQKATNIFVADAFVAGAEKMENLDKRVKKVEDTIRTAGASVKAGWSTGKTIAVFIVEAVGLAGMLYGVLVAALN